MPLTFPVIFAHRGAQTLAPENTLAAFRKAKEQGAKWIEFDVMLTKDGIPVVIHDDTVDRTTNGTGRVVDFTLAELKNLRIRDGNQLTDLQIPTLEETLDELGRLGLCANLEIKPNEIEPNKPNSQETTAKIITLLKEKNWLNNDKLLLSSFQREAVATAHMLAPEQAQSLLVEYHWQGDETVFAKEHGCISINIDDDLLKTDPPCTTILNACNSAGLPILVFTVNEPARVQTLFSMGISGVFTNNPECYHLKI